MSTNVLKMDFVTKGPGGELLNQGFTFNSLPQPQIAARVINSAVAADGTASVTLGGTVTDQASDLVHDPALQPQQIEILVDGVNVMTVPLVNQGQQELPWRPYAFEAPFSCTVQVPTSGVGHEFEVGLRVPGNVAGCGAEVPFVARVAERTRDMLLNIEFVGEGVSDVMMFYAGDPRAETDAELLIETPPGSGYYAGTLYWAEATVALSGIVEFTGEIDTFSATVTLTYSNGIAKDYVLDFVETGGTDGRFTAYAVDPPTEYELGGTLNLVLPEVFNDMTTDACSMYIGTREPGADDYVLGEVGGVDSLTFNGDAAWADVTVTLVNFQGLTDQRDTITTHWVMKGPDGTEKQFDWELLEVEGDPLSRRFCLALQESGPLGLTIAQDECYTPTGTFFPSLFCVTSALDVFEDPETVVTVMDRDWHLKKFDFGDGERAYAVDDQGNPVVFLPAANAHSHIQCKRIDKDLSARITISKTQPPLTIKHTIKLAQGMMVKGTDVEATHVTPFLVAGSYQKLTDGLRDPNTNAIYGKRYYIYQTGAGGPVQHVPVAGIPANQRVRAEIIWRLVGMEHTASFFDSSAALENMIRGREATVVAARTAAFQLAATDNFARAAGWVTMGDVPWGPLGFREVQRSRTHAAIRDVWSAGRGHLYAMGCKKSCCMCILKAATDVFSPTEVGARLDLRPFCNWGRFAEMRFVRNATCPACNTTFHVFDENKKDEGVPRQATCPDKNCGNVFAPVTWSSDYYANWIPGDWGAVNNLSIAGGMTDGENVIYLGGCFSHNPAEFREATGTFWGMLPAGGAIASLNDWVAAVDAWSAAANDVRIQSRRTGFSPTWWQIQKPNP